MDGKNNGSLNDYATCLSIGIRGLSRQTCHPGRSAPPQGASATRQDSLYLPQKWRDRRGQSYAQLDCQARIIAARLQGI